MCIRDRLQNVGVHAREFEPGLARLLGRARGDDHHVGVFDHLDVAAALDARRRGELGAVVEVAHLGVGFGFVDVVESDLLSRAANQGGVGKG